MTVTIRELVKVLQLLGDDVEVEIDYDEDKTIFVETIDGDDAETIWQQLRRGRV